jgi:acetylornithine/N-succinyldiaminopimelate aminotransferase
VLKPDASFKSVDIVKAAMAEGLLLVPAGPQVVRFVPPLIVNADEVQQALMATEKALAQVTKSA